MFSLNIGIKMEAMPPKRGISLYHDAHCYADVEKLEHVFHQEAQIIGHYHSDSFVTKRDDYRDVITADAAPDS